MIGQSVEMAIDELREGYASEFRAKDGVRARLGNFFAPAKLRSEVQQDWIIVHDFAERARTALVDTLASSPKSPKKDMEVVTVARALACLDAAKKERNFAAQWLYVNTADELLPLVAPDEDLEPLANRLGAWDVSMPPGPKKVLDESKLAKQVADLMTTKRAQAAQQAQAAGPGAPPVAKTPVPPGDDPFRTALHNLQQVRAQCWNEANHQIAFMGSLWLWAGLGVLIALTIAVAITEIWVWKTTSLAGLRWRFVSAAFLGFFGGALSAFLSAREKVVAIPRYQLVAIYTLLRMLVGAAGSFVVVLSILAFPLGDLTAVVQDNVLAFLFVAIAAGFSERLFVSTLEKAAMNLSTVSKLEETQKGTAPNP